MSGFQTRTLLMLFTIACFSVPALARNSTGDVTNAGTAPSRNPAAMPHALRPALFRALERDAGNAYRIGNDGCVTLSHSSLEACFDRHGAQFAGAGVLAMRLTAYGRGTELKVIAPVKPVIEDNRVSYPHGVLSEWWKALPMGFEQGFTLAERPKGHGELVLALETSRQDAGAPFVRHSRASGNPAGDTIAWGALRYGKLVVTDADGQVIPSSLKARGGRILITVDDAHATYPLIIDPLIWIEQKVTASDAGANNVFGRAVAVNESTAFITNLPYDPDTGQPLPVTVYVFTKGSGTWSQTQSFPAPDGTWGSGWGPSIIINGNTAFIGSYGATINGNVGQGAVYVYGKQNGNWVQEEMITASDGQAYSYFGKVIAFSGNTLMVGSFPGAHIGSTYVFTKSNGVWTQTQKITASDPDYWISLGHAIAINETTAFIRKTESNKQTGEEPPGKVLVYTKSNGSWMQTQMLGASDGMSGDHFGRSIAFNGTTAIIGADNAEIDGSVFQGAAYIFTESGSTWSQTQKLVASDGTANRWFGIWIALSGSRALIADQPYDNGTWLHQPQVYVFANTGGTWSETRRFASADTSGDDFFGSGIALDGTIALISAPDDSSNGSQYQGAAYFYGVGDLALALSAPAMVEPDQQYTSQTIVTNSSGTASAAVTASIVVPAAASFVSASATQGGCSAAAGVVICEFGSIP
ncbi:MAG: FG-GAP repeat protein, partial [Gammaproteobacteria bacterium]|nr:FG-GAP repeat protein [Gammaproteobacteria bacterium]